MIISGEVALLEETEQKLLGIAPKNGVEYLRRLPLHEALEATQNRLQAVELDMGVTWYSSEDVLGFIGYSVLQVRLNEKLEKLTDMAASVLVHETEQFLALRR